MDAWSSIVSLLTMETAFCASQPSAEQEGGGWRGDRVVAFFWPPIPKPKLGKRFFGGTDGRTIDLRRKIEVKNFLPQIVPFDGRTLSRGRPRP